MHFSPVFAQSTDVFGAVVSALMAHKAFAPQWCKTGS
jgi:hypothetical protein